MAEGLNEVRLLGNLGQPPDLHEGQNGDSLSWSMATTTRYRGSDGNWHDDTQWHRCVCFGRQTRFLNRALQKGTQVLVIGRLQTNKYEKNGETRYSTNVVATKTIILARGRDTRQDGDYDSGSSQSTPGGQGSYNDSNPYGDRDDPGWSDDDIPF